MLHVLEYLSMTRRHPAVIVPERRCTTTASLLYVHGSQLCMARNWRHHMLRLYVKVLLDRTGQLLLKWWQFPLFRMSLLFVHGVLRCLDVLDGQATRLDDG